LRWLALLAACACGAAPTEGDLAFDLYLSGATADLISAFQVAVVQNGTSAIPDCAAAQKKCLVDQLKSTQLAQLTDAEGKPHLAILFPASLKVGTPSTQDVTAGGIAPGSNFAVVIEALSKSSPPTLVGSSCNYVQKIDAGRNPTLIAATIANAPVACDPRFEK
jgi:hypothetical protein